MRRLRMRRAHRAREVDRRDTVSWQVRTAWLSGLHWRGGHGELCPCSCASVCLLRRRLWHVILTLLVVDCHGGLLLSKGLTRRHRLLTTELRM
jgi:hypothetical protein